jgi:hypothetical protein
MSSNNISIRPGNDGIIDLPGLNVSSVLYIKGKKFEDYITELVIEDQFEQAEITELKLLVQYLDTSGLNSAWLVDNQNKNQELKTAITALQTKLAQIDTTALTLPSVLTNDNRNSVLKTRLDGHDGNLGDLFGKTRYVSSVIGTNTAPKSASDFQVSIADREKRRIYMTTGVNQISMINDSTNQATQGENTDNQIIISAQNGMVQTQGYLNSIRGGDTIEITGSAGMGVQTSPNIKIGNKGAQILIGSEDTPELNQTNTVIKIGKRTITRNTETQLRGNILTTDARFTDLTTSPALTFAQLGALITTTGMPAYISSSILTSVVPNFSYSDLWSQKGVATKDGDVETTTTPKMKGYSVYDSTVDIDILPKVQTFLAKGDISETTLLGSIRQQTFNGEILLRNNNIVATNIDWALTDAMDKVNALKLSNNDVELIAGAGANNSQLRISNTCTNGKMRFRMGSGGLQSNSHDALAIYNDPAASTSQVLIAGNNVPTNYDTQSKILVDHQFLNNGIKVTKQGEGLITRINHNNINTPSLTLQTNWGGATANSLYLNASNQLMYNGSQVGSGSGGATVTDMTLTAIGTNALRKPAHHGKTWSAPSQAGGFIYQLIDTYGTNSGEIIVYATRNGGGISPLFFTGDSGTGYQTTNPANNRGWISVCGTITGDRIYAVCNPLGNAPVNQIFRIDNGDFGIMTQVAAPALFANNNLIIIQMRCSHEGKYLLMTEASAPNTNLARIFKSDDFGETWTTQNLSTLTGYTLGCAMNSDGKYQFVCVDGTSGGVRADTGSGGLYRSSDFGATWTRISFPLGDQIKRVACDGTGAFVLLADMPSARVSRNYGTTFRDTLIGLTRSCYVSNSGQFMIFGLSNGQIRLSRNYGIAFNPTNITPVYDFPAVSWDTAYLNNDASIMSVGNIANSRIGTFRETELNVRNIFSLSPNNITITDSGNRGEFGLTFIPGTPWNNDIRITNATPFVQMNPTLTNPLDLNQYVYEIQIETYLTGHAPYLMISFNEVFNNLVFGGTGNRHVFSNQYTKWLNPDNHIVTGEFYRDSNASWYTENLGDFTIWGYLRPLRSVRYGANGTNNENLGILFHGQSWFNRKDNTSNTSLLQSMAHSNFHKIVYALPLITRSGDPYALLNNINYISVNTAGNPVLQNLRLRTRIHSPIDRN